MTEEILWQDPGLITFISILFCWIPFYINFKQGHVYICRGKSENVLDFSQDSGRLLLTLAWAALFSKWDDRLFAENFELHLHMLSVKKKRLDFKVHTLS